jgi:putative DNA primase/helicase
MDALVAAERDAWKERARSADILDVALQLGAKLKRVGRENVGPCPVCAGHDGFGVNPGKRVFVCRRGEAGGDVIALVQHVRGGDFISACEFLAGPPPTGGRGESPEERRNREREIERRRAAAERRNREREAQEASRSQNVRSLAHEIWRQGTPISDTLAETYLRKRGIEDCTFPSLRFASALKHPDGPSFPALLCAVQAADGKFLGVWRIFLSEAGGKAPVANPKLGLGPCGGGAVWFGKPTGRINLTEGVETALGVRGILSGRETVVAALSTSGMRGFIVPEGVTFTCIWPDGDMDRIRNERLARSPGLAAAEALSDRLKSEGHRHAVQPTPQHGRDYLDVYNAMKRVEA